MSVDTYKPAVARAAVAAGAVLVNDVCGPARPRARRRRRGDGRRLVVMHTRAAPEGGAFPDYAATWSATSWPSCASAAPWPRDARAWPRSSSCSTRAPTSPRRPRRRSRSCARWTAARARPPGAAGRVSRKYLLGAITGRPPGRAPAGTLAALGVAAERAPAIVRVHDVAAAVDHLAHLAGARRARGAGRLDEDDDGLKWIRAKR